MIRLLGAAALGAALAVAGCSASPASAPRSTASSGTGTAQASFRKCLERHGISLPAGGGPGGGFGGGAPGGAPDSGASPRPRPSGLGSSTFRKAIQACGGFRGGPAPAG